MGSGARGGFLGGRRDTGSKASWGLLPAGARGALPNRQLIEGGIIYNKVYGK